MHMSTCTYTEVLISKVKKLVWPKSFLQIRTYLFANYITKNHMHLFEDKDSPFQSITIITEDAQK